MEASVFLAGRKTTAVPNTRETIFRFEPVTVLVGKPNPWAIRIDHLDLEHNSVHNPDGYVWIPLREVSLPA